MQVYICIASCSFLSQNMGYKVVGLAVIYCTFLFRKEKNSPKSYTLFCATGSSLLLRVFTHPSSFQMLLAPASTIRHPAYPTLIESRFWDFGKTSVVADMGLIRCYFDSTNYTTYMDYILSSPSCINYIGCAKRCFSLRNTILRTTY